MRDKLWAAAGAVALSGLLLAGTELPYRLDPSVRFLPPSWAHWLGTDELGRDLAARLWVGTGVTLAVALAATLLSAAFGISVGLVAGYRGGAWDAVLNRLMESVQAVPKLPLLILVGALEPERLVGLGGVASELAQVVVVFGLLGWVTMARVVRFSVLQLKQEPWVEGARGLGLGGPIVVWRHVLPHLRGPIAVTASLDFADAILLETSLSFLGMGVQPPLPSLGNLLSRGLRYMVDAPWLLWPPGVVTVLMAAAVGGWAHRVGAPEIPVADPARPR